MEHTCEGNFEFVREIFPELYELLCSAESQALTDHRASGDILRILNERYCNLLMEEYGISTEGGRDDLAGKQYALHMAGKLPRFEKYTYRTWTGVEKRDYWNSVWRRVGNACHHPKPTDEERAAMTAAVTYENLITVFEIVFRVFKWEYGRKKGKAAAEKLGSFSRDRMPIKENYILRASEPIDGAMTHCIREYETCSFDDSGRVEKYGIVRVFNKNDMDEKVLALRDKEAFKEASDEAGIQFDGNVQVDVISRMNSTESDFYIIIYKFSRKPARLDQGFLSGLDLSERIRLCRNITEILKKFHDLSTPIYHRNFSYDSIYICQNKKGELEPSIIKLDCAKIVSEEYGTVIETVQNREKVIQQKKILKYAAPEVRRLCAGAKIEVDWARADVYSLGVLFGDILRGSFDADPASSVKLKKEGVDPRLADLTKQMSAGKPDLRPSMEEVAKVLEEVG